LTATSVLLFVLVLPFIRKTRQEAFRAEG